MKFHFTFFLNSVLFLFFFFFNNSALFTAVKRGKREIIKLLLANEKTGNCKISILKFSVFFIKFFYKKINNDICIIVVFITFIIVLFNEYAFNEAMENGYEDIVYLLLSSNIDVNFASILNLNFKLHFYCF